MLFNNNMQNHFKFSLLLKDTLIIFKVSFKINKQPFFKVLKRSNFAVYFLAYNLDILYRKISNLTEIEETK